MRKDKTITIDAEKHIRLKVCCAKRGISIKDLIHQLIEKELEKCPK
jgi:hypothetical protein